MALEVKKAIDAICDQFEQDWKAGRGMGIEAYLGSVDPRHREPLFRELATLEMALSSSGTTVKRRQDYLTRFPNYAGIVNEIFSAASNSHRVEAVHASTAGQGELAEAAAIWLNETIAPTRETDTDSYRPAGQMWTALDRYLHVTSDRQSPDKIVAPETPGLETAAGHLISAFPERRNQIVRRLFLGESVAEVATKEHVSERTVINTYRMALEMLAAR